MAVHDIRTARLLAERMVNSFFDGLAEGERNLILAGGGEDEGFSPLFSMLSYTFDVFLQSVSFSEDEGRDIFKAAVQKKLKQLREEIPEKNKRRKSEEI